MLSTAFAEPLALAGVITLPGWAHQAIRAHGLRRRTLTDRLTGLGNRDALALAVHRIPRRARAVGLLLADLNGFKAVNDTHGHDQGDVLLQHVAGAMRDTARGAELPVRLHGDEFAVLLGALPAGEAGRMVAAHRASAYAAAMSRPLGGPRGDLAVTAAIGATVLPIHQASTGALLRHADVAMYGAKNPSTREVTA